MTDEARKYTMMNTHNGLFQYLRMPFGITNAPALFQGFMEKVLAEIPNTVVYLDA